MSVNKRLMNISKLPGTKYFSVMCQFLEDSKLLLSDLLLKFFFLFYDFFWNHFICDSVFNFMVDLHLLKTFLKNVVHIQWNPPSQTTPLSKLPHLEDHNFYTDILSRSIIFDPYIETTPSVQSRRWSALCGFTVVKEFLPKLQATNAFLLYSELMFTECPLQNKTRAYTSIFSVFSDTLEMLLLFKFFAFLPRGYE